MPIVPAFGLTQDMIFVGNLHWLIQTAHLLVGIGAMAPMRLYPLSLAPAFGVPLAFILHFTGLAQFWYLSRKQAID